MIRRLVLFYALYHAAIVVDATLCAYQRVLEAQMVPAGARRLINVLHGIRVVRARLTLIQPKQRHIVEGTAMFTRVPRLLALIRCIVSAGLCADGRNLAPTPKELPLFLRLNSTIHEHNAVLVADLALPSTLIPNSIRAHLINESTAAGSLLKNMRRCQRELWCFTRRQLELVEALLKEAFDLLAATARHQMLALLLLLDFFELLNALLGFFGLLEAARLAVVA